MFHIYSHNSGVYINSGVDLECTHPYLLIFINEIVADLVEAFTLSLITPNLQWSNDEVINI